MYSEVGMFLQFTISNHTFQLHKKLFLHIYVPYTILQTADSIQNEIKI